MAQGSLKVPLDETEDDPPPHDSTAEALKEVLGCLSDIKSRLSRLESQESRSRSNGGNDNTGFQDSGNPTASGARSSLDSIHAAFVSTSPSSSGVQAQGVDKDLFDKYAAVKEATKDVEIPGELLLSENWYARADAKRMITLLRKSYSFIITQLKLLKKLTSERDISAGATKLLLTTLVAHARTLQSESTTAFLEGAGSYKDPMSIYKALSNNNNLTKNEVDTFKLSSKVFVAAKMCDPAPNSGSSGGSSSGAGNSGKGKSGKSKGRVWWNKNNDSRGRGKDKHDDQFDNAVASVGANKP